MEKGEVRAAGRAGPEQRLSQLEAESRVEEDRQAAEQELRLVIGQSSRCSHLQRVKEGLRERPGLARRDAR